MKLQDFNPRSKPIIKQNSQITGLLSRESRQLDIDHHLSELKYKGNFIKINKNKLPNDFFSKKDRRVSQQKLYFRQQQTQPLIYPKKVQSQRLICSPDKTSFFGFIEEKKQNIHKHNIPSFKLHQRNFQTRQQSKRDIFGIASMRKVTNTSKAAKRDMLDLYQETYDQQLADTISLSSRTHAIRPLNSNCKQSVFTNPQQNQSNGDFFINSIRKQKQNQSKFLNASLLQNQSHTQSMNVTFCKAKSNCLPPINRNNNQ